MWKDGDFFGERQFRPWRQTNCQFGIIYGGEAARPGAEVVGHQFIADLCGSRTYTLEAKVTHFWTPWLEALSPIEHYHSLLTAGDFLNTGLDFGNGTLTIAIGAYDSVVFAFAIEGYSLW